MWIDRQIEPLLLQRAETRPVVVLTGAGQTGKTSLVRRLFPDHGFVSLDLPSEADQAERDAGSFLARHPPRVIIDEVQYAPGLFRHLKMVVDWSCTSGTTAPGRWTSWCIAPVASTSPTPSGRNARGCGTPPPCGKLPRILPEDAVASLSIVCRAPNAHPLTDDVQAVPLDGMPGALLGD